MCRRQISLAAPARRVDRRRDGDQAKADGADANPGEHGPAEGAEHRAHRSPCKNADHVDGVYPVPGFSVEGIDARLVRDVRRLHAYIETDDAGNESRHAVSQDQETNVQRADKTMATLSVTLGRDPVVIRPTADAASAPATPTSPKRPATCAPMLNGGAFRRKESVVQKALNAPNIAPDTMDASLSTGRVRMSVRSERIRAKYSRVVPGRERGRNSMNATARNASINEASL